MNNDLIKEVNEILLLSQNKNIIDIDDARNYLQNMKKEIILKQHKYEIWQGTGKDTRWKTHLPPNNRIIAKQTKEALENAIVEYYSNHGEEQKCTLKTLYSEWLEHKTLHTTSTNYIRRIDNDWNKYYRNSPLIDIPLKKLDYLQLDEWAHNMVKDNHLTKTQFYNMQIIIKQSLEYAVERKILSESPYKRVKVQSKMFTKPIDKPSETQVFLVDEQPEIEKEALKDFNLTKLSNALSVILAFQTGLRIGELVGLKYSDIEGNYLHIQRMEVRTQKQNEDGSWQEAKYVIVEHVKTDAGDRKIYLTSKARETIELIKDTNLKNGYKDNDYIFVDAKGRLHTRALDYRLRKCCERANISEKSMHKIRKTYISTLIDKQVNIDYIRRIVGHEDAQTTYNSYCYNTLTDKMTENLLERALCS